MTADAVRRRFEAEVGPVAHGGHSVAWISAPNGQIYAEVMASGVVLPGRRTFELAGRWNGDHDPHGHAAVEKSLKRAGVKRSRLEGHDAQLPITAHQDASKAISALHHIWDLARLILY